MQYAEFYHDIPFFLLYGTGSQTSHSNSTDSTIPLLRWIYVGIYDEEVVQGTHGSPTHTDTEYSLPPLTTLIS